VGFIRVGDYEWPVKQATLGAKILPVDEADLHWGPGTGGISWHFHIDAEDREIDGELMSPRLYSQVFVVKLRTWKELEGQDVSWSKISDAVDQDWPGICIFEHEDIIAPAVRFGARLTSRFDFALSGRYAYFSLEAQNVEVETAIRFVGVNVRGFDPETTWLRLCEHLDGRDFAPAPVWPSQKWGVPPNCIGFEPLDV
jgi:hypothetical protein